jgi:NADPH-dependent curcumin reductase CurA
MALVCKKVDPTRAPIQTALGVLGMPGMTAYMGLVEIGKPTAGEPWWSRQLRVRYPRRNAH